MVMAVKMALMVMETTTVKRMEKDHKGAVVVVQMVMEMVEMAQMVVLMVPTLTQEAILTKTKMMTMVHANLIPFKSSVKAS